MDYDFRNNRPSPLYGRTSGGIGVAGGLSSFYPKVGQPLGPPPPARQATPPYSQQTSSSSSSSSSGLGIRVTIKPEYRITPPPQLAPQMGEVPRSTFQFDFDFERKILAEAEKGSPNWSKLAAENLPSKTMASNSSVESVGDPILNKYIASGLGREPVLLAVLNYGDNPVKVREFVKGYNLLREMGFSSKNVGEALAMHDNDTDKALGHLINSSS